jgi:hypothetical protein
VSEVYRSPWLPTQEELQARPLKAAYVDLAVASLFVVGGADRLSSKLDLAVWSGWDWGVVLLTPVLFIGWVVMLRKVITLRRSNG